MEFGPCRLNLFAYSNGKMTVKVFPTRVGFSSPPKDEDGYTTLNEIYGDEKPPKLRTGSDKDEFGYSSIDELEAGIGR